MGETDGDFCCSRRTDDNGMGAGWNLLYFLCIMESANLPTLFLETDSGTIEQICADKEYEENGKLTVIDEMGNVQLNVGLSSVKG